MSRMSIAETTPGVVCVPNITPKGARRRSVAGRAAAIVAVGGAVALAVAGAPPWAYLLLGGPIGLAAVNWFQVREKT